MDANTYIIDMRRRRHKMIKPQFMRIVLVFVVLVLASLACSGGAAEPTETPEPTEPPATNTPLPEPTNTIPPTNTPKPSKTPDLAATQAYDELYTKVLEFADQGIIPTSNGKFIEVDDFKRDFAQIGYLRPTYLNIQVEYFVFMANVKWSTAIATNDTSGCGIVFAGQEDGRMYGTVLDRSRIYFTSTDKKYFYELGKTRGSGRLDLGNPAEVNMIVVAYDNYAYVYVDNQLIGEYTLSMDKPMNGYFGYGIISGTNKDYGTRCEITESRIWEILP
jgi:hypothetical protein